MKNSGSNPEYGFSLIEMLIVLVVLGILTAFAIFALGNSTNNLKRQNITKEFKVALERARFDSVKRRAANCADMSRVEILNATSFRLFTDMNQNGTIEAASESRLVDFGGNRSNVQIVDDPAPTYPIIIRFDQRGHTSSGPCGTETAADTPTVFCEMPCTAASATATNSNIVAVSPTGTVAFLNGGDSLPTFDDPANVSNVTSSTDINNSLAVWTGIPPSPNTNTNTSSNTNTNTVTNTNTNPNTNTSLPACTRNQRPGTPATCSCQPPMFVGQSGKCS